jgi:hypothetical protein
MQRPDRDFRAFRLGRLVVSTTIQGADSPLIDPVWSPVRTPDGSERVAKGRAIVAPWTLRPPRRGRDWRRPLLRTERPQRALVVAWLSEPSPMTLTADEQDHAGIGSEPIQPRTPPMPDHSQSSDREAA